MSNEQQVVETKHEVRCERCGYVVDRPTMVGGMPYHQGPAHCDQLVQVAEIADFLQDRLIDADGEAPAEVVVLGYAAGKWHLDAVSADRTHVRVAQAVGESLAQFLLRISGGLLPLP